MISKFFSIAAPVVFALATSLPASAQGYPPGYPSQQGYPQQGYPQQGYPQQQPGGAAQNPVCGRLEGQLTALDRGNGDPGRADQIRRYEDAANKQQAELDRMVAQSRRAGCEGSGFFLFGGQPPQCGPLNSQIQQMRGNLDRIETDLQRLQSSGGMEREGQRRALLTALNQNNCGPQYRSAARAPEPRGFFDSLFGGGRSNSDSGGGSIFSAPEQQAQPSGTFRTVCVRTCDGFYYPISFATVPSHFQEDAASCQRMCPAAEVQLYSYPNPGGDVSQAVSMSGQQYSALPTAFRYRKEFDAACSCRQPGQSWLQALKQTPDNTLERGDIVVTEENAKALSKPRVDAQGRPIKPDPRASKASPQTTTTATPDAASPAEPPKGKVRTVGPPFIPAH